MWPWLLSAHKKYRLWRMVLGISVGFHAILLLLLFVAYRGYYAHYDIDISKQIARDTPVVFLPLCKTVRSSGGNTRKKKKSVRERAQKKVESAVPKVEMPAAPVMSDPVPIAQEKAPTTLVSEVPKESAVRKTLIQRKKKKQLKNRMSFRTRTPSRAEEVVKTEVAATPIEQAIAEQPQQEVHEQMAEVAPGDDNAVYVGQLEHDALALQEEIFKEIEQHWSPPVGLGRDKECQVKVIIDFDGAIKELVIEKTSGILAFDVSARTAIMAMVLPKASWGKEVVMHFKS